MVKYTLLYFNGRGKAELCRLLFAQAGVEYEDKRVEAEEWGKLKAEMPQGVLPVLEVDGEKLCQSLALARFLAREFSMYGSNNLEAAKIDAIVDTISESFDATVAAKFAKEAEKERAVEKVKEKVSAGFKYINDILAKSKSGFLVGAKLSLADLAVYHAVDWCATAVDIPEVSAELKKNAKLAEHREKIANLPKIKEWLKKRPATDF